MPITIDRSLGCFAYDPSTVPRATLRSGDAAVVETRDPRSGALLVGPPDSFQPYPPPPGGHSNALTGPIAVEGLRAGEVLAVTITRITPEPVGYMAAKDLGFVVPLGSIREARIGVVGVESGVVRWRGIELPYRPMVGCLGVAHPEGPSSGSVGPYGGNFDHIVVTEGCTVYLPTFVDGGLLYVGDVHAAMGDGELSCGGVEIAATVGLRVRRCAQAQLTQPRFETASHVVTTGWGHDFAAARRMAVADMLTLLTSGLGISTSEAFMLTSVAGDLRIGQSCGNMELTLRLEMPRLAGLQALPTASA